MIVASISAAVLRLRRHFSGRGAKGLEYQVFDGDTLVHLESLRPSCWLHFHSVVAVQPSLVNLCALQRFFLFSPLTDVIAGVSCY